MLTPEQRAVLTVTEEALHDLAEVDDMPGQNLSAHVIALVVSLAEARRDHERTAFCRNQFSPDGEALHCALMCYFDKDDKIIRWELTTETWTGSTHWINLGSGPVPAFTPEARAIIDAARAAEEKTNATN